MTAPIKTFGVLALAATFAGTAFAGNGGVTGAFQASDIKGSVVTGKTIRPCPMMKPVYKTECFTNPKLATAVSVRRLVGYRHEGCTGTNIANMKCAGSKTACATMVQS